MDEAKAKLIELMKKEMARELEVARWLTDLTEAGSLDKDSALRQAALHRQTADGYGAIIESVRKRWEL